MTRLFLDISAARDTVATLKRISEEMRDALKPANDSVKVLLDGMWVAPGANSFDLEFSLWQSSAILKIGNFLELAERLEKEIEQWEEAASAFGGAPLLQVIGADGTPTTYVKLPSKPSYNFLMRENAKTMIERIGFFDNAKPGCVIRVGENDYIVLLRGMDPNSEYSNDMGDAIKAGLIGDSEYFRAMRDEIYKKVPRGANLHIFGHSQGGIIAGKMATDKQFSSTFHVKNVITYGSPDTYKLQELENQGKINYQSYENPYDPVPELDRNRRSDVTAFKAIQNSAHNAATNNKIVDKWTGKHTEGLADPWADHHAETYARNVPAAPLDQLLGLSEDTFDPAYYSEIELENTR